MSFNRHKCRRLETKIIDNIVDVLAQEQEQQQYYLPEDIKRLTVRRHSLTLCIEYLCDRKFLDFGWIRHTSIVAVHHALRCSTSLTSMHL